MKKLFLSVSLLLLANSAFAANTYLSGLACTASNGVILSSEKATKQGVEISSQWGIYTKDFFAKLGQASNNEKIYIELYNEDGSMDHFISLAADAEQKGAQIVYGTLWSSILGAAPALVASVKCEIQLRNSRY